MEFDDREIRKRREWEDTLLNTRTGIFLILNGFAIQPDSINPFLAIAIVCINLLWVLASLQSSILIKDLTRKSLKKGAQSLVDASLGESNIHHLLRPTNIIGKWVPLSIYFGWVSYVSLQFEFMIPILFVCLCSLPIVLILLLQKFKNT